MKTFKLKSLEIIENKDGEIFQYNIPLSDGLIIDREDEESRWVIEAYMTNEFHEHFKTIKQNEEIMIQVKISKESNDPATFITSIINMTAIRNKLSVLFMGTIVDQRQNEIEDMLKELIEAGYYGEDLLDKFKELTHK